MSISKISLECDSEKSYNSIDLVRLDSKTSSQGNQTKWVTADNKWFIKGCFSYQNKIWRDYLVELIASDLAAKCNKLPAVKYEPCFVDGEPCVRSLNFLTEDEVFIPFGRLLKRYGIESIGYSKHSVQENFNTIRKIIFDCTGINSSKFLYAMALIDYIVANEDRHLNNFGVVYNQNTCEYRMAPLFDWGLGLLEHDIVYYEMPVKVALGKISGQPFASRSYKVGEWLKENLQYVQDFLPKRINIAEYKFPSYKAQLIFMHRLKEFGVEVVHV